MSDTKMQQEATQITSKNTYDETPYESYPYAATRPETLKATAHIFGLETPSIETARFLELGCASGGNIIPHAVHYPKAKFVGIDLSNTQIEDGNKQIKALGLKNIELKTMSITDVTKSFGEFDYIICHGVISWVPENVREAIFRISNENLSKNGIAYISYNTLPGWNMVRTIRDMMLFHSRNFANINDKVQQSRLLLNFVKDSLGENNPYGDILENEAKILSSQPDHYLRHDHMEDINHQYYFHEFMKEAAKHDLQYLADSSIASMYSGNLPPQIAEKLKEVPDIIRSEQYMDFVTNRRFRSTILCKKNVQLNRAIDSAVLNNLYCAMKILPEQPMNVINIENNDTLTFYHNGNKEQKLSVNTPILKALLYVFNKLANFASSIDEIISEIQQILGKDKYSRDQILNEISNNMMRLLFSGYLTISCSKPSFVNKVSDKPQISEMARAQLDAKMPWITNENHDKINLDPFAAYALRYLDGKNTHEQIIEKLVEHIKSGDLSISQNNEKVTETDAILKVLKEYLPNVLAAYASNAILVG